MTKRKSKKLLILLGVLAVISAVTLGVSRYENHVEKIKSTDETILSIDSSTVTALSWVNIDETLAFHKDGEKWIYDEDETFPVDPDKIESLLSVFNEFRAAFEIEDVVDYGDYELDDPICTIKITAGDEKYTVLIGGFSKMDEQRYVSIGDGKAYLAETDPYDSFNVDLRGMILNDKVPNVEKATQIKVSGADDYEITYQENGTSANEEDQYYAGGKPLDTDKVSSYLMTVSNIALTEYEQYSTAEDSLEQYGLDDPELTLSITYPAEEESDTSFAESTDNSPESESSESESSESESSEVNGSGSAGSGTEVFTLHVSRNRDEVDQAKQSKEEDAEDNVTAYARVGESSIIYKITSQEYSELIAATYNDMRHAALINADFDDINMIDIALEGETYELTSKGRGEDRKWYFDDGEVEDILTLRSAMEALAAQDADSFCNENPDSSRKEEIRITAHLDNEDIPQIEAVFYRYDGTDCLATVDGEPFAYIARDQVVNLIEAVHEIVLK